MAPTTEVTIGMGRGANGTVEVTTAHKEEADTGAQEGVWDDDEDDEYWDDIDDAKWNRVDPSNKAGGGGASKATEALPAPALRQAQMNRLQAKVNFDPLPRNSQMGHAARNSVVSAEKKAATARHLGLTQDTRATVDQVLDPRTMLVLSKFLKAGIFEEIHGCISTGKEANVYYATGQNGRELAVKVYKTSILVFKDRARYVEGEFRFRAGYCKGNPRKMVAQWAEKELRNLRRLKSAGIPCPDALELRQNVLVMDFIGDEGDAAPRLKDVEGLGPEEWSDLYFSCVMHMRTMMQSCRLVHGDLSEYNMLLDHEGRLIVIDVGQAVENDHPQALNFLKRDCINVNNFFAKRTAGPTIPVRRLFEWIAVRDLTKAVGIEAAAEGEAVSFKEGEESEALTALLKDVERLPRDSEVDEEVFVQTWIPSNLNQVSELRTMEKEMERRARGEEMLYSRLLAVDGQNDDEEDEDDEEEEEEEEDEEEQEDEKEDKTSKKKGKAKDGKKEKDNTDSKASKKTSQKEATSAENPDADAQESPENPEKSKKRATKKDEQQEGEDDSEEDEDEDEEDDDGARDGHKPEDMDKHAWKAMVKEEKRKKREEKIPKSLKKKFKKQAARGR
eukprot:CAMPEP_0206553428 /NCGR_PEP_ID=MMETSP0325_2-20121206/16627_1 /ASSEMBLY_ACC=CAM_ASM_000347 /TAXON_ID=2866 /ORGANISM="Crypthecodinium cohnii, Strain Seligo" /LENGTH=616 /DNA_ID=CAMNT_0054053405 /DNA_START=72 /DNA_END=1922 /DNA_ORIENTATION=-